MHSMKDKRWFTQQVRPMLDTLYRIAYTILENDADAQDAAQNTLEQAYVSLERLKDRSKFRPWLMRILKNECYMILRSKKRVIPFDDLPEEGKEPFDALDLKTAFSRLSPESRLCITLYYYEGYNISEIAAFLNEPEGTVKSRLSRARKSMRQDLTDQEVSHAE
jgi:RNA polymerase sigma-70 factor (ECF subfamily)